MGVVRAVAAVNRQRHGRACHQRQGRGLAGFRTVFGRPLLRTCFNEPPESIMTGGTGVSARYEVGAVRPERPEDCHQATWRSGELEGEALHRQWDTAGDEL
jgi:hypothetical protein